MRRLAALGLVLALLAAARPARASTHFAVTLLRNRTRIVVRYQYRWGNGPWMARKVWPGHRALLAYRFMQPGRKRCPWLYVRFIFDRKVPTSVRELRLESNACERRDGRCGKMYDFVYDGGTRFIDLKEP